MQILVEDGFLHQISLGSIRLTSELTFYEHEKRVPICLPITKRDVINVLSNCI